jgi:hypothetical protein
VSPPPFTLAPIHRTTASEDQLLADAGELVIANECAVTRLVPSPNRRRGHRAGHSVRVALVSCVQLERSNVKVGERGNSSSAALPCICSTKWPKRRIENKQWFFEAIGNIYIYIYIMKDDHFRYR